MTFSASPTIWQQCTRIWPSLLVMLFLYNYQLSSNVGAEGVMGLTILVQLSATCGELYHCCRIIDPSERQSVRYMTPPFGMYTALSAQMAGSLRHTHSRLVEFAEEVAFMRGEHTEKMLIERRIRRVSST